MKRVLIIEDEPWLAELYENHLSSAGLSAIRVSDARQAIEYIDQHRPDLLLLDLMLPHGNGLQLLHEMQSYTDLSNIPVVIYSSAANRLPKVRWQAYGVVGVFDKSQIKPSKMARFVQEILAL